MKKRIIGISLVVAMSVSLIACGTGDDRKTVTEDAVTENESVQTEIVDNTTTEEVAKNTETTETMETDELSDTEETEIAGETEISEESQKTKSGMGSVNREDFVILDASWGYSNYVDYVEATGDRLSEAIIGYNSEFNNGQIAGQYGESAITNKGIHLGSTRDEVVEAYGTNGYDGPCGFKVYQVEGHMGVSMLQLEYLESPTHHYYLYLVFDENNILVGMGTSCWIEQ